MPSSIPGYEYDIFISYRHKDNLAVPGKKETGWVTEFVNWLKKELQATSKENISIYFDENPHDGLLGTHVVHDSLQEKLKCLIFIPIVSQTYCDPKSFAWAHEFIPFRALAEQDDFGLKVRLHNGNVSSRILPVCIHVLDPADQATFEKEMGHVRGVDFVFRSPGINRPLTSVDKREDTVTKILYSDQVNKLANAIKELMGAMTTPPAEGQKIVKGFATQKPTTKSLRGKLWILWSAIALMVVASIYAYFQQKNESTAIEKSIAVLPFDDMSAGHDLEYIGDGISEEIINSLTSIRDLRIVGRTSSFQFKGQKLDLREIGRKLNVSVVLEGSVQQSEGKLRITAQLIRTSDNTKVWSSHYDVGQTDIFKIQDKIAAQIVAKLNLTLSATEENRLIKRETTDEAYMLYLKGFFQYKKEDFTGALKFMEQVIALDSQYAPAFAYSALSKAWNIIRSKQIHNGVLVSDAKAFSARAVALDPGLPEGYSARALIAWAIERDYSTAKIYFDKSIELDPGSSLVKNRYAYFLLWMNKIDEASALSKNAMQIDPGDYNSYTVLYLANLFTGKVNEAALIQHEWENLSGKNRNSMTRAIEIAFFRNDYNQVTNICDSLAKFGVALLPQELSYQAGALYKLDNKRNADEILKMLRESAQYYILARTYAVRDQADSTFHYLNKAMEEQDTFWSTVQVDPLIKPFHQDPRFAKLLSDYGFDRY